MAGLFYGVLGKTAQMRVFVRARQPWKGLQRDSVQVSGMKRPEEGPGSETAKKQRGREKVGHGLTYGKRFHLGH